MAIILNVKLNAGRKKELVRIVKKIQRNSTSCGTFTARLSILSLFTSVNFIVGVFFLMPYLIFGKSIYYLHFIHADIHILPKRVLRVHS